MEVVWKRSPISTNDITDFLKPKKHWTLATVSTLLKRLVDRGALLQELDGKRYLYFPRVSVEECVTAATESFLERVMGRAPPASIMKLVQTSQLTKQDIAQLRSILREKER